MTAATLDPTARPALLDERGPSLATLTRVELRKMSDTRAGRWLLAITALLLVALPVVYAFTGPDDEKALGDFFQLVQFPTGVLLPVLGILLVASEWSQRTALTTFTLVPDRRRIVGAKAMAVVLLTFAALAISLVAAAIGTALAGDDGSWALGGDRLGELVVMQLLGFLTGFAFGLAFQASAPAIVLYFLLPTIVAILTQVIPGVEDVMEWVDLGSATVSFGEGDVSGTEWGRFATAQALWLGVPLLVGLVRLKRSEIK